MKNDLALYGGKPALQAPLKYVWPQIDERAEQAVLSQLHQTICIYDKSGIIGEFEDAFAHFHTAQFALVTSSGTAALHSAYYALGIKPGDEVICPDYTFFATAMPLFQLGALPVLADCGPDGGIAVAEIERLLTPLTKAVVVTHMWGWPCEMQEITRLCREHGLGLIEDCSHAHGASYRGQIVGTFGHAGAWSLQAQKIIAAGEGGILVTNERDIYDRAQLLGHFNKRCLQEISPSSELYRYAATGMGLKYRAHPLGIALANSQLPHLESWLMGKERNARRLISLMKNHPGIRPLAPISSDRKNAYYALVFLVDTEQAGFTRDELVTAMTAEGFVDVDIPKATSPLHTYPIFQNPQSPVIQYAKRCVRGTYEMADYIATHSVKISVPVETTGRGLAFVEAFEIVWNKVTQGLSRRNHNHK